MSTNHHTSVPAPGPLCVLFAPRLSLLVLDKLEATEAAEAHVHLAECAYCQRRLGEYEILRAALHRHFGVERSAEQAQLAIPVSDAARELSSHQSAPQLLTLEDIMTADEREQHARQVTATSATSLAPRWNTVRPGLSPRMMTLSSVAAALILVIVATTIFAQFAARRRAPLAAPGLCAVTDPQRHGLACDIPLPPNAVFDERGQASSGQITVGQITMVAATPIGTPPAQGTVVGPPVGARTVIASQILLFRAPNTTPEAIHSFYAQQLPAKGWTCVQVDDPTFVFGMQGNRAVNVAILPEASADTLFWVVVVSYSEPIDTSTC